jgi:hypothetical protein
MSENPRSVFHHPALEEKGLNEIPAALVKAYHDARAELMEDHFDSAIGRLNAILEQEPGFYECRRSLHAARLQRGRLRLTFAGQLARRVRNLRWLAEARFSLRSHPDRVLRTGERILDCDCANLRVHKLMAKAALRATSRGPPRYAWNISLNMPRKKAARPRNTPPSWRKWEKFQRPSPFAGGC